MASARLNQGRRASEPKFACQEDYGAFSFDRKRLPYIIAYVEKQKNIAPTAYLADYNNWLEEMSSFDTD